MFQVTKRSTVKGFDAIIKSELHSVKTLDKDSFQREAIRYAAQAKFYKFFQFIFYPLNIFPDHNLQDLVYLPSYVHKVSNDDTITELQLKLDTVMSKLGYDGSVEITKNGIEDVFITVTIDDEFVEFNMNDVSAEGVLEFTTNKKNFQA
jgi:hypothetical protein